MIAVLKYNAGNVQSVLFALERLGVEAVWTDDPDTLIAAAAPNDKVEWRPRTMGRYDIRVVDDHGRAESRWVTVAAKR